MDLNFSGIAWAFTGIGIGIAWRIGGLAGVGLFRSVYGPGLLALHGFGVCCEMNIVYEMLIVHKRRKLCR
jgi:hypothetical protein